MNNIFKSMIKHKWISLSFLIVIIAGVYYWQTKGNEANQQLRYVTQAVEKNTLITLVSATGNVTVDQAANIDPTISGTVSDLAVKVGDSVKEGQTLFTIVNDDLTVSSTRAAASLQQAKNTVESANVAKDHAKAEYKAAKKKDDDDGSSYTSSQLAVLKDKIDLAENEIIEAQKSYAATAAEYRNQISEAGKRIVKASISGTVNEINVQNGDDLSKLSSGSTRQVPIIIGDLGTLRAEVQVNEVDIPDVQIGQKAMMTLDAFDGFTASGKVEKIDALGTISSGVVTYNVTINFDSLDSRIKPNMSVTASIIVDSKVDILAVSTSAIKIKGDSNYVEVLNPNGIPEKRTVEIGISNDTNTEITSGLSVGDKVITQVIDNSADAASSSKGSGSFSSSSKRSTGMMGGMMGGGPPR